MRLPGLDVWSRQLAEAGAKLIIKRIGYLDEIGRS